MRSPRVRPSTERSDDVATLELRNLVKRFGGAPVVDGVDLTIPDGAFVALLGPSGCGKTTLLRLVAGFLAPDAGEIAVGGRTLSAPSAVVPPEQRGMSMIFQSYALWPHMTVEKNVGYGLRLRRRSHEEIARRVATICTGGATRDAAEALSRRAVRRTAAGGRAGARAGRRTADLVAGRAALQPRHEPARS